MGKIKWQAVFFDFDGVILDSVDVKTRAFAAMFRQYGPEIEQAVVEYHLANGGVSRFEKFKYYYRHLLQKAITQEELDNLNREFSRLALEGVLAAPYIDGAMETLECLSEHNIPAFVVSGTPHVELQHIVEHRNLTSYFHEVHGSPREKHEIVKDIASRYSYRFQDCLFVGDAMTDYDAAQACGTDFLGIYSGGNPPFPEGTRLLERVMITENRQ